MYSREPDSPWRYGYLEASEDWPKDDSESKADSVFYLEPIWTEAPLLYIPATRVNLSVESLGGKTSALFENLPDEGPLKYLFETETGVFCGHYVQLAIDWLSQGFTPNYPGAHTLRQAVNLGYSCAKAICSDVINDNVPHSHVEFEADEASEVRRKAHYGMGIGTTDSVLGEPLYAGVLSSGTQGTLLWVWALALKIAHHYDWQEEWEKKPAILLIDEIENHLHPTWQRRVIPALLEHFPGLQIFATTHSPFVVAGLKAGQVHLLKRDENGLVTAETNPQDIIGWTMDEILRTMMGVDDPTDQQTAEAAEELRALRNGVPAPTEAEEEKRQECIRKLRQKVDRDLLAGGPAAAQREIFEEQFAAALEKYRQSRELNQENG